MNLTTILTQAGIALAFAGMGWLARHVTIAGSSPATPAPAPTTPEPTPAPTPAGPLSGLVGNALVQLEQQLFAGLQQQLVDFLSQAGKASASISTPAPTQPQQPTK